MAVDRRGLYLYSEPQDESDTHRAERERFWRSLGKQIRAGILRPRPVGPTPVRPGDKPRPPIVKPKPKPKPKGE